MKIITNPDTKFVKEMWAAIRENNGYCPCRIEKTPDTKCMCKDFREMEDAKDGKAVRDYMDKNQRLILVNMSVDRIHVRV